MTSASTRVPSLSLLALRVEATANQYARHLLEHGCAGQSWCSERDDLDFEADVAAYGHMFERQRQTMEVR